MDSSNKSVNTLRVEGLDDQHTIVHLLKRHDIECVDIEVDKDAGRLIRGIPLAIKNSTERTLGFVVDANDDINKRWQQIRDRLFEAQLRDIPRSPTPDGYRGYSERYRATVGVWIMPDNKTSGAIEALLETLIPDGNKLYAHARTCTSKACDLGATFKDADRSKAELSAWLAWQKEPGRPYGTALKAKFFEHDSAVARAFVSWYKKLFEPDEASGKPSAL